MAKNANYIRYKFIKDSYLYDEDDTMRVGPLITCRDENQNGVYTVHDYALNTKYTFNSLIAMIYFIGVKPFN